MRLNKKLAAIAMTATVALTATAAFAFFTSTGNGTGSVTAGSASQWTVSNGVTSGSLALYPGTGSQTVSYTVTNASTGGQNVGAITVTVANSGLAGACLGTDFAVNNAGSSTALGIYTGGQVKPASASISLTETGLNQDACQGVTPVVNISVS